MMYVPLWLTGSSCGHTDATREILNFLGTHFAPLRQQQCVTAWFETGLPLGRAASTPKLHDVL